MSERKLARREKRWKIEVSAQFSALSAQNAALSAQQSVLSAQNAARSVHHSALRKRWAMEEI